MEFIRRNKITAIFLDEWKDDIPLQVIKQTEILWCAPRVSYYGKMYHVYYKRNGFQSIHLQKNLRNTKEVVQKASRTAEDTLSSVAASLVKPPEVFPTGPSPMYVQSVNEAISSERKKGSFNGILVISDMRNCQSVNPQSNGCVKKFPDDFSDNENPCEFLNKEGNILVVKSFSLDGFEWPTIIVDGRYDSNPNMIVRCKVSLYIVGESRNQEHDFADSLFTEYASLVEITGSESSSLLLSFKRLATEDIVDGIYFPKSRDLWLKTMIPILKQSLAAIHKMENNNAYKGCCLGEIIEFISKYIIFIRARGSISMEETIENKVASAVLTNWEGQTLQISDLMETKTNLQKMLDTPFKLKDPSYKGYCQYIEKLLLTLKKKWYAKGMVYYAKEKTAIGLGELLLSLEELPTIKGCSSWRTEDQTMARLHNFRPKHSLEAKTLEKDLRRSTRKCCLL